MVRVGGLQVLAEQGHSRRDPAGMTPEQQLRAVSERVSRITADQYHCYLRDVEPGLAGRGIKRLRPAELSPAQLRHVQQVFDEETQAVLTPMAVTSANDFPLLLNLTLNVAVQLPPDEGDPGAPRFAVIPLGRAPSRFITLPSEGGYECLLLEDLVQMFVQRFFPGESIVECAAFRITRNAEMDVREDMASDLLAEMEDALDARRLSDCIRLEITDRASAVLREFLQRVLEIREEHTYALAGPLDLSAFTRLTELQGFDALKYEPWPPQPGPPVDLRVGMFENIARQDIFLYHPYEGFEPVHRLIEEAADDPDVLAIKQTLYRTSRNSPSVAALLRAAGRGKYVTAVVDLKARFDEARNIEWAKNLEQAGVQVIYGVRGLKTHAKLCIVVRREPHGIQRYVHFGTGNYNEITARLYTDVSFMTNNAELGADATSFFNAITGYSQPQKFRKIEAAPIGLRDKLLEMIQIETERQRRGHRGRILAKLNSLVDPALIDALYEASQAGVDIRLNVRGICCLRPGVADLSENITVISVIDRFLEHARIFYFYHGGDERLFISSADWMPRNLDRRVELLVPVEDAAGREKLMRILDVCLSDNVKARQLMPDGSYRRLQPGEDSPPVRSQQVLYEQAVEAIRRIEQSQRTVFEPHRAPGAEV
jgi:polyphosphate kinase